MRSIESMMAPAPSKRKPRMGLCRLCGKMVEIKRGGRFARHTLPPPGDTAEECDGGGEPAGIAPKAKPRKGRRADLLIIDDPHMPASPPPPVTLRPMAEAPQEGEILVATTNRAGCRGWLIVHHADGGGEEQPRFRGWFYWTGYDFREMPPGELLGWLPLPDLYKVPR